MKKSRFTDSQITAALKRVEAGLPVLEFRRQHMEQRPQLGVELGLMAFDGKVELFIWIRRASLLPDPAR